MPPEGGIWVITVKEKKVVIKHISADLIIVNPLTKSMPPMKFKDHVDRMKIVSSL